MSLFRSFLRGLRFIVGWLLLLLIAAWAFGAVWYDFPLPGLRKMAAAWFALVALAALVILRPRWMAKLGLLLVCVLIAGWWLMLQPRNDRSWQPDVAETPWAEIDGDAVTLHNIRNCDYRSPTDYTPRWETRTLKLSRLTGVDAGIDYWGSDLMAHPMLSFQFADAPPVVFSIETRKEVGESYSAIGGLYRQFELIYIAADERDVFRLRTNYRQGEDLYLYHTTLTAAEARERFMEYVTSLNEMRTRPRWYNAVTTNCTTAIRAQHSGAKRVPWDWRLLVNGKMDALFYEMGVIATDGLPFAELKKRALINSAAKTADQSPDFSKLIREGRPGFGSPASIQQPGQQ